MLATLLLSTGAPTTISDDFQRADGPMGVTSVGFLPWVALAGTWSVASHLAHTTASYSTNPLAVVETGFSDGVAQATVSPSGGDCLYFRVVDASNWLRLRVREYNTTQTTYYGSGWTAASYNPYGQNSLAPGDYYFNYVNGVPTKRTTVLSSSMPGNPSEYQTFDYTQSVESSSSTVSNYQVVTEKSVAGTVTQLNATAKSSVTTLKANYSGSTITAYANDTQIWAGTVTDFTTATKHGVGLGGPTDQSGSAISALSVGLAS